MTTTHLDLQRDLGRMEGRLDAMDDRLSKIETIVERVDQRLARIEVTENQRQGAFRFGHWLFGAACAFVTFIASHLLK